MMNDADVAYMSESNVYNLLSACKIVKEKYPDARRMLINDNGSKFISNDFKELITRLQIQQVFTRQNHPQTNGKIERMNKTVKDEAIRVKVLPPTF
jgi:transposase InsO family protein